MDYNILKTVGQIAGIGGLSLGVFLLLFRDIIRKNIFSSLTRDHSYRIIRLILFLVFTLALVGIATWVYTSPNNSKSNLNNSSEITPKGILEVSDIIGENLKNEKIFSLDCRVLNKGTAELLINRLRLDVVKVDSLGTTGFLSASQTYDVDISDLKKVGDSISINISQSLKPKEADRFIIKLAANNMQTGEYKIWQLKASFVTSEGLVAYPFPVRIALPFDIRKE